MTKTEFIAAIAPLAVQNMNRSKVPASLTIAQSALESAWGTSGLTVRANNLFGIKGMGPAGSVTMQTTEYVNGKPVKVSADFRSYNSWEESISDHTKLLENGVSWNRNLYSKIIGATGRTAALEIAASGYATDPNYATKLIDIMDMFNLYQYDHGIKEVDEMSDEDKKKLADLEKRLAVMESRAVMDIPVWAESAVKEAVSAGVLDTPNGGSYDFYRLLTILNRAGLLKK